MADLPSLGGPAYSYGAKESKLVKVTYSVGNECLCVLIL